MKKILAPLLLTLLLILAVSPVAASSGSTGSIVRIFGNVEIEQGQVVNGDVVTVFGNITVRGEVYGSAVAVLGNTTVTSTGRVWEDTITVIGNLNTHSGSSIAGSKVNIIGNGGEFRLPPVSFRHVLREATRFRLDLLGDLASLAFSVVLAVLIAALFPVPVDRVRKSIERNPGRMALIGLLTWVIVIPLIAVVALTIIGIPLAFLMGLVVWAAGKLGAAGLAVILGGALLKNNDSKPAVAAVGALLLGVATIVPVVGWLLGLAIVLITMGAATVTYMGTRDEFTAA